MTRKQKGIIGLIIILLLCGGAWWYVNWKSSGALHITLNEPSLITVGEHSFECESDCTIDLIKQGGYFLQVEKEGFLPHYQNVVIKGRSVTQVDVKLTRIPTLRVSEAIPKPLYPEELPIDLNGVTVQFPAWHRSGDLLAYYSPDDARVMLWSEGYQPISKLSNPSSDFYFKWGNTGDTFVGIDGNALYWFDVYPGRRQKVILPFAPTQLVWSNDDAYLLLNDRDGLVYQLDLHSAEPRPLDRRFVVSHSFFKGDALLYFQSEPDSVGGTGQLRLLQYSDQPGTETTLATFEDFVIGQMEPRGDQIYLLNALDETWYVLEF